METFLSSLTKVFDFLIIGSFIGVIILLVLFLVFIRGKKPLKKLIVLLVVFLLLLPVSIFGSIKSADALASYRIKSCFEEFNDSIKGDMDKLKDWEKGFDKELEEFNESLKDIIENP